MDQHDIKERGTLFLNNKSKVEKKVRQFGWGRSKSYKERKKKS